MPSDHGEFIIELASKFDVLFRFLDVNLASPRAKRGHVEVDKGLIEKFDLPWFGNVLSKHLHPEFDRGAVNWGHVSTVESYSHLLDEIVVEVL